MSRWTKQNKKTYTYAYIRGTGEGGKKESSVSATLETELKSGWEKSTFQGENKQHHPDPSLSQ